MRKYTHQIQVGNVSVGGNAPISVQSMCNTDTRDVDATVRQIDALTEAGCQIIRVAVPDRQAAEAVRDIKTRIRIPLVADIHFDYRLALTCIESGIDKIRINPGNIGDRDRVRQVVDACKARRIPIRIGVNGGSLERPLIEKYGAPTPEAMVDSALGHVTILEELDFDDICISLKASDVPNTIAAYRLMSEAREYPLHVGITETGTRKMGIIKSAAGIGGLVAMGIGDTIRVSLTDDPLYEVEAAYDILKAVGAYKNCVQFVSCPTCGRTKIDIIRIAAEVEQRLSHIRVPMKVAVMGCAVNGPGEARDADVGLAGGDGVGLIFSHGEILKKVPEAELVDTFVALAEHIAKEKECVK
ncbi:MAG: flavodoxin-dependent (E)-4-hydroxy-3-methylbut-2-enyl-diphosphate synthase [Clostridia bacterium]|nr:flavodoxin-dependent (E)-4-hydroxy-3-methylbut-2-enyl-diphosphate synthase [Clostridia bacterium]